MSEETKPKAKKNDVMTVKHDARSFFEEKAAENATVDLSEKVNIEFTEDYIRMKKGKVLKTNRVVAEMYVKAGVAKETKK